MSATTRAWRCRLADLSVMFHSPLTCERHNPRMEVSPLPAIPDGDEEMVRELFTYLALPSPEACQRDLALGAHVVSDGR